ncbi:Uncharacterised protein [Yersinia pekkanenii]|uniref:Uncharacterized protein n=1 Tax=Yersinia pekkanenii TaxID=1288385 RepID=A0A0T9QC87_9GAMM|nr:Uncharacterised protein [Yersinia pekkanenii]CRY68779.1 Uncharacterised protein [Yersinia pekkanenii]
MVSRSMTIYSKLEIKITYDLGEGNQVYTETLMPEVNRFRFSEWFSFNNQSPPEFIVLDDGDFIRSLYIKRVTIRRFKKCADGDCPDQYEDYLS